MTETRKKYSLAEQEYTAFISGLIQSAVAVPMEGFTRATLAELARSATELIEARDALRTHIEQSGERLKSLLSPLLNAVDDLNFKVDAISSRAPDAAPANGLHDTLAHIGERLKSIETDFASGLKSLRTEVADTLTQQRGGANAPAKLREEDQSLLRQLQGSVAGMAETLPDITRQLDAQRAASEGTGRKLAELHARLDEQVRLLISELKQSGQSIAGATLGVIKETEARLDGRLAELGDAVVSSADGVAKEFPALHERLGGLDSQAARQQGRLDELARRVETFQSEATAGFDAALSGLTQAEQSLGRLISSNVESAVALITEGQAGASQKMLASADAVGAAVKESAEFIGLEMEETRRSVGVATADARSKLSEQVAQATSALAASLGELLSGHTRTWQEVDGLRARLKELAGNINQTRQQLDSVRQTVVKESAGVASSLMASDEHADKRLQRLAAELTKTFGGRFDKQTEETHSNMVRLQSALQGHVTELQKAIGTSTDALRQGLNSSLELSRSIERNGSNARTALETRIDRGVAEQQNLKRSTSILFGFTVFNSVGIIAILLYLLSRTTG
jgi:hypothetical protein